MGITINDEIDRVTTALDLSRARLATLLESEDPPERAALADARLHLSKDARRHFVFFEQAVLPAAMEVDGQAIDIARHFRATLQAYHASAAHHVARWSSNQVSEDWKGYQTAAKAMLRDMADRRNEQDRFLLVALASIGRRSAAP